MDWKPTKGLQEKITLPTMKITEPPCKWCNWFKPEPVYLAKGTEMILTGTRCCVREEGMKNDFTCYYYKG